jgi:GR25 family glycosyltransferase involved in LPS biosynthesis
MDERPLRCCVINLARSPERLARVRGGFEGCAPPGWALEVFAATDGQALTAAGRLSPGQKGCFTSHLRLLEQSLEDDEPLWVLEDDVVFSPQVFGIVRQALAASKAHLLFTDVGAANPDDMLKVMAMWPGGNAPRLLDLKALQFLGASSYVVAGGAKRELVRMLKPFADPLDVPYDVVLRHLIHQGAIAASVTLPFFTTLSEDAERSQIDPLTVKERVWNTTRRLFFVNQDLDACEAAASQVFAGLDDRKARVFGLLMAARVSADYRAGTPAAEKGSP